MIKPLFFFDLFSLALFRTLAGIADDVELQSVSHEVTADLVFHRSQQTLNRRVSEFSDHATIRTDRVVMMAKAGKGIARFTARKG